jgi:bifunctional UDP-N-acetylglucosamine pyrophosphorylase / glucosamine-1-phosphate N-acetyltransferase
VSAPNVLILAAGQGTRMRSHTPKMLHELCGRPMVLWPVRAALDAGASNVVVVDSPARALETVLPDGVRLAVQERSDGTGGAAAAGLAELGSHVDDDAPVVVLAGDVPLLGAHTIEQLVREHLRSGAAATVATAVLDDPSGYGRVVRDSSGAVQRVVETKHHGDATRAQLSINEVNTGVLVFAAHALRRTLPMLGTDNAQAERYLPQALDLLVAHGASVAAHVLERPDEALGVNDRAALARARALAQHAIHERHMLAGVTVVDPAATVIDADAQIGRDTVVEPFTSIRRATRIGRRCTVRCSYLVDCQLHDDVTVGPFAYLRPGTVLHDGAKVGTFVEVKNSHIGSRAKIPHLSYIGDAHVGDGANLGASTITANYDGRAKHRTVVQQGVHTGVHTSLVAPVNVGRHAVTAAGSVITHDLPARALGIARARQVNKEGYARPPEEGEGYARPPEEGEGAARPQGGKHD